MGINIPYMEMPKSCDVCPHPTCTLWQSVHGGERNEKCPIIPVPPHGRCVDADALWVEINKICDRRDAGIITDLTCLQQILSALRHAPTIIPAELPVHHGTFAATSEQEALKRIAPAEEGE